MLWFSDSLVLSSPYTLEPIDLLDGFRLMRRLRLSGVSGDELISLSDAVDEPWLSVGDSEYEVEVERLATFCRLDPENLTSL